jgi:hypothetical protein
MAIGNLFRSALLTAGASLALASAAFAADPPAPPASPAAAPAVQPAVNATPADAATPAPAATSAPAATPATAATPEAKAESDAASNLEKKFQEAARSYRKVEKNGETMYCKKEKPINSPSQGCSHHQSVRLQVDRWTIFATVCATAHVTLDLAARGRLIGFTPAGNSPGSLNQQLKATVIRSLLLRASVVKYHDGNSTSCPGSNFTERIRAERADGRGGGVLVHRTPASQDSR